MKKPRIALILLLVAVIALSLKAGMRYRDYTDQPQWKSIVVKSGINGREEIVSYDINNSAHLAIFQKTRAKFEAKAIAFEVRDGKWGRIVKPLNASK